MLKVRKCISSRPRDVIPVFESMAIPEWMESLHSDDRRRESVRLARLKHHIGLLDDLEGVEPEGAENGEAVDET